MSKPSCAIYGSKATIIVDYLDCQLAGCFLRLHLVVVICVLRSAFNIQEYNWRIYYAFCRCRWLNVRWLVVLIIANLEFWLRNCISCIGNQGIKFAAIVCFPTFALPMKNGVIEKLF